MATGTTRLVPALGLVATVLLGLFAPCGRSIAQSTGDHLPPPALRRAEPGPPRSPPPALRSTIDGRETTDPGEAMLRPAARDGDVLPAPEPQLREGFLDMTEPEQPGPEGIDTSQVDARPASEFAAFETANEAQLFQTEDIDPVTDRRVRGLFRAEPYAPVGYRIGSFVLFPQLDLAGVTYSNVQRLPKAHSDIAMQALPELRFVSNWQRHAIELRASGNLTFHDSYPGEDDRGSLFEARGRLDLSRQTNLQGLLLRQVTQESRFGVDANRLGQRADVTTTQAAGSINQRFNRLTVQFRGSVTETDLSSTTDDLGNVIERPERHRIETEEAVRFRYDRRSGVGVFVEAAVNQRTFEAAPDDGIKRDSSGERYRAGVVLLPTNPRLRGEISVGFGAQRFDDPRLLTVDGLLIDANLVWRMTPVTSLLLTAHTDLVDSVTTGVSGVLLRSYGVELRHSLQRYLTATAGLLSTNGAYRGARTQEEDLTARIGLEYALSREVMLYSRYDHIWFDTNEPIGDWQADEVRVGMRIRH